MKYQYYKKCIQQLYLPQYFHAKMSGPAKWDLTSMFIENKMSYLN